MSIANPSPESTTHALAQVFSPIERDLALVSRRLREELSHPDPFVNELASHSFRIGGKRLRPALLLLAAKAIGEVSDAHHVLGAVVEMIHTATLVHDDVLDEASIRRHELTVNARWNNQTSVLLGDYLFSHAYYMASTLETTFGCRTIGRSTNIVCEGELKQTSESGNFDLSTQKYFEIIDAKTAELCACCCLLGAHYAGAEAETVERLEKYGRHLGVAFQIADDLLDLEGEEQLTGKSLGTDLVACKMTLPLILLRDELGNAERETLQGLIQQPTRESRTRLMQWLGEMGLLQESRRVAAEHAAAASAEIACLPDSPAKASLLQIAEFVTSRQS